jgi:hypothetical protein
MQRHRGLRLADAVDIAVSDAVADVIDIAGGVRAAVTITDGDAIRRLATLRRAGLESELQRWLVLQSVRLLRELDVVLRRWL